VSRIQPRGNKQASKRLYIGFSGVTSSVKQLPGVRDLIKLNIKSWLKTFAKHSLKENSTWHISQKETEEERETSNGHSTTGWNW
jgi:hypothetical protein